MNLKNIPNPYAKQKLVKADVKKYEYYNVCHGMEYNLDKLVHKTYIKTGNEPALHPQKKQKKMQVRIQTPPI